MTYMRQMLNRADQSAHSGLELIRAWFEGLPQEIQAELAIFLSTMLPELAGEGDEASAVPLVRQALRGNGSPVVSALRTAAFSAAIDVIFLQRSTQEAWLLYGDFLKQFRDTALADGKKNAASLVQSMIEALPERCALWIKQAQGWSLLRSQMEAEPAPGKRRVA